VAPGSADASDGSSDRARAPALRRWRFAQCLHPRGRRPDRRALPRSGCSPAFPGSRRYGGGGYCPGLRAPACRPMRSVPPPTASRRPWAGSNRLVRLLLGGIPRSRKARAGRNRAEDYLRSAGDPVLPAAAAVTRSGGDNAAPRLRTLRCACRLMERPATPWPGSMGRRAQYGPADLPRPPARSRSLDGTVSSLPRRDRPRPRLTRRASRRTYQVPLVRSRPRPCSRTASTTARSFLGRSASWHT
jgi:hypothetical protein